MMFFNTKKLLYPIPQPKRLKIFNFQKTIEDLAKSLKKATFEIDNIGHFLTMNLCKEHDSF